MREEVLDALRSTWAYVATLIGVDPPEVSAGLWESIADDVVAEAEMWMSAFAVMPDGWNPAMKESQ